MKTPEPTKMDADYYPRIKHNRRWYLIVPEISYHDGCAFQCGDDTSHGLDCTLIKNHGGDSTNVPLFKRHDCGDNDTIFVTPAKFPEYLATIVANKLEGKT
jgi:hypothetical protein